MKNIPRFLYLLIVLCCISLTANQATAQNTFDQIYDIIQVRCTGCHGGGSPSGNLDMDVPKIDLYNTIVSGTPTNPAAVAKGWKLIDPGYPERSYILHKIARDAWDTGFSLTIAQGDAMPPSPQAPLSHKETELFRQWILDAAPFTGQVVDPLVLEEYYETGIALPGIEAPEPPASNEGFQIRLGPIFLAPQQEIEFFKRYDLQDTNPIDVNKLKVVMNDESHHFIIYRTADNSTGIYPQGIRDGSLSQFADLDGRIISTWQNNGTFDLPEGTAYKWGENTELDLNFHLRNYSVTGIVKAEVYINVYTQPGGSAPIEMFSELLPVGLYQQFFGAPLGNGLVIPANGNEVTFTDHVRIPNFPGIPFYAGTWHIWSLSSHTHARGTDFDIYMAEAGGAKGEQIYEGFFNTNYTFNQGFYDWEHPATRFFEPLLPVPMGLSGGLVQEAKFVNDGEQTLFWGDTTEDEMMITIVQYTEEALSTSTKILEGINENKLTIMPNPFKDQTTIQYELDESANVRVEVYNAIGKQMAVLTNQIQQPGVHQVDYKNTNLAKGLYFIRLTVDGKQITKKVLAVN